MHESTEQKVSYWPLGLCFLYILLGTALLVHLKGEILLESIMADFMGLFFLSFSFFKLLDIKAFAKSYKMYDTLSKNIPFWAFIYPFIELLLGVAYMTRFELKFVNLAVLLILGLNLLGVLKVVLNKKKIQCACLGTVFNLPMSKITIIEDTLMIVMALLMLFN